ncbi:glycosyltransferase family 2 protein [Flavobacterium sp. PL02]|uniref:glycosyltransferase family 2 protein n=1 Tax=Flavobacterium sp. PL02 TaxID=3088354 RepID=UPI002B22F542|nr:glycosyltransferase family 2 protein [Flavobacterium sp. PL02]MEA9413123.1 glycosyltransferase family 2 protein [Flavobacterium sp. PL02]
MESLVYILLASYNGEKYIETQLESLLSQTYTNWCLLIRDDGSTDCTLGIIEKYIKRDARIKLVDENDLNKGKGACQNFHNLIKVAVAQEASFIFFCDQDDYWFPDKVEKMMHVVDKSHKPTMLYSSFFYADNNLKKLPKHVQEIRSSFLKPSFKRVIVQNTVYGCTMMINYQLAEKCLPIPLEAENHDYWIALVATGIGAKIDHLDIPLMLYRQHDNNVSGNYNDHSNLSRVKRLFMNWNSMKKVQWEKIKMINTVAEQLKNELLPKNLELLEGYLNVIKYNNIRLISFCIKYGIKRHSFLSTIVFYFVLCSLPKVKQN